MQKLRKLAIRESLTPRKLKRIWYKTSPFTSYCTYVCAYAMILSLLFPQMDLLQVMLDAVKANKIEDAHSVVMSIVALIGGHEPITNSIIFTSHLLATNGDIQQKLITEIAEYFSDNPVSMCVCVLHVYMYVWECLCIYVCTLNEGSVNMVRICPSFIHCRTNHTTKQLRRWSTWTWSSRKP